MGSKIFKNEILVRDKRIYFLENLGGILRTKKLPKEEIVKMLNQKLLEEAKELFDAIEEKDIKEIEKEFSDLQEVMEGLQSYLNLDNNKIKVTKEKRKKELGGYEEGAYIETIEIDEENPLIDYYLDRPEKYPQVNKQKD